MSYVGRLHTVSLQLVGGQTLIRVVASVEFLLRLFIPLGPCCEERQIVETASANRAARSRAVLTLNVH